MWLIRKIGGRRNIGGIAPGIWWLTAKNTSKSWQVAVANTVIDDHERTALGLSATVDDLRPAELLSLRGSTRRRFLAGLAPEHLGRGRVLAGQNRSPP
jgi:hypothetical protein